MSKDFPFLSLSLHCHLIIDSSTRFLKWWIRHLGTKDSASATPGNAPDLCFPTNNGISKIEIDNLWRATYGLEKKNRNRPHTWKGIENSMEVQHHCHVHCLISHRSWCHHFDGWLRRKKQTYHPRNIPSPKNIGFLSWQTSWSMDWFNGKPCFFYEVSMGFRF